jgi:hypothetical protein
VGWLTGPAFTCVSIVIVLLLHVSCPFNMFWSSLQQSYCCIWLQGSRLRHQARKSMRHCHQGDWNSCKRVYFMFFYTRWKKNKPWGTWPRKIHFRSCWRSPCLVDRPSSLSFYPCKHYWFHLLVPSQPPPGKNSRLTSTSYTTIDWSPLLRPASLA